jgi:hypothetical protein
MRLRTLVVSGVVTRCVDRLGGRVGAGSVILRVHVPFAMRSHTRGRAQHRHSHHAPHGQQDGKQQYEPDANESHGAARLPRVPA